MADIFGAIEGAEGLLTIGVIAVIGYLIWKNLPPCDTIKWPWCPDTSKGTPPGEAIANTAISAIGGANIAPSNFPVPGMPLGTEKQLSSVTVAGTTGIGTQYIRSADMITVYTSTGPVSLDSTSMVGSNTVQQLRDMGLDSGTIADLYNDVQGTGVFADSYTG